MSKNSAVVVDQIQDQAEGEPKQNIYVELKNVNKAYGDFKASDNVSFKVQKGHLVGLIGPSGSGKTTILRILAGLETADSGDIYINGVRVNNISAQKRGIGFVFQSYALFRYQTVFDNVAFGLRINKKSEAEIKDRVLYLLSLVGLAGLQDRYPNQLSGGQRQRVAFARALATEPQLLLLDEPFAAIDAKVRQELRSWLKDLIHRVGITSIFVTHDQDEAFEVADQIILTNRGRIEQSGTPFEIYNDPQTSFNAKFIGHPVEIKDLNKLNGFSHTPDGIEAVVRPEYISVAKVGEKFQYSASSDRGVVIDTFFRGAVIELYVKVGDNIFTVNRHLSDGKIEVGEEVYIFISRVYLLNGDKAQTYINEALEQKSKVYII